MVVNSGGDYVWVVIYHLFGIKWQKMPFSILSYYYWFVLEILRKIWILCKTFNQLKLLNKLSDQT
jgi:hypothetical protein